MPQITLLSLDVSAADYCWPPLGSGFKGSKNMNFASVKCAQTHRVNTLMQQEAIFTFILKCVKTEMWTLSFGHMSASLLISNLITVCLCYVGPDRVLLSPEGGADAPEAVCLINTEEEEALNNRLAAVS